MPVANEGLEKELGCLTSPSDIEHIRGLFEHSAPLMHDIAYCVIAGCDEKSPDYRSDAEVGAERLTKQALDQGFSAKTILDDGLVAGMAVVGLRFRDNRIYVPEVALATRCVQAAMKVLRPVLSASEVEPIGTAVVGTVKGDFHDIGKDVCIMMLRGAGFTVHDLGVDTKPEAFIDAVVEQNAQIVGMSASHTSTMPNMRKTIEAFEEAGLRDRVKVMVGGAPLRREVADDMGADGYCRDATACVDLAKRSAGVAE